MAVLFSYVLLSATVLLLVSNYSAVTTDARVITNEQRFDYDQHVARVKSFKCRHPRHRAVSVAGWFNLSSEEKIDPEMTVLHRCDAGAGCCPMSQVCAPVVNKSVDVELVFRITNFFTKQVRYESVVKTNHTQCGCQDGDLPK